MPISPALRGKRAGGMVALHFDGVIRGSNPTANSGTQVCGPDCKAVANRVTAAPTLVG
jgi:hypothetical protein